MDSKTVHRRVEHEGLSFLTITLTNFGKDFERGLDQGYVDRHLFQGFSWKGGLPRFLGGFLDQVFDRYSGLLLDVPSVDAIRSVRQLTLMYGKLLVECSLPRREAAFQKYIECEQEVRNGQYFGHHGNRDDFLRERQSAFGRVFLQQDHMVYAGANAPRHGPGATCDGYLGNSKYNCLTWTTRLEEVFPFGEYLLPSWSDLHSDRLEQITLLEPEDELPVRVTDVPKTLKTPRIIAIEPTCMTYVQQGLLRSIVGDIERDDILSCFLGFSDQTLNQRMAREGSLTGELATLDLSEASDRVSNQHVEFLFMHYHWLKKAVAACRSTKADVPGYGIIPLSKFASMGSSLCFPIEAMVFLTVIFVAISRAIGRPLTAKDRLSLRGKVRVYGDDIIVPVEYVEIVVETLELFGFKVNSRKSFWTGKFRESCGKEYYGGEDVSIVRFRRVFPTQRRHTEEVVSLISFRNQLYYAGYWKTCAYLDVLIERIVKHYPIVEDTSVIIGRTSFLGYQSQRTHPTLHSPLVKGVVRESRPPASKLDGSGALLKFHLRKVLDVQDVAIYPDCLPSVDGLCSLDVRALEPLFEDPKHLERAGRPRSANLRSRWAQPF
jgi:hypothetical protein